MISPEMLSTRELAILKQLTTSSLPDMGKINALELALALSTLIGRMQELEKTLKITFKE